MRIRTFLVLWLSAFLLSETEAHAICPDFGLPSGSEIVELDTNVGTICLELLRADAPITVWNFVNYVSRGDYDGTIIHRSVPGFVIQGGALAIEASTVNPIPIDGTILNEPCTQSGGTGICTERGNIRGTVAMARIGGQINSATSQYFINLADNRSPLDSVDEGFTVFANVLGAGMAVADSVAAMPIGDPSESWWIAPSVANVLGELPLQNGVPFFPTAFGCWDPQDLAVVVSPLVHTLPLPDPFFGTTFYPLSGGCGTQIPRFTFVEDPGPPHCPDFDLLTTGIVGLANPLIRLDPATGDFLQYEFSCEQAEEAVFQRDLWRGDLGARSVSEMVVIETAAYQTVPEPGLSLLLGVGAVSLALRGRTRTR